MRRALLIGLALLWAPPAPAHDVDVATFALRPAAAEDGARGWILDIHVPQAALQRALERQTVRPPADPVAWREAAVAYLRSHVRITSGGASVRFGGGGIKVGGHQTDARFLYAIPDGALLSITINAFAEDDHQSNVLKLRGATPRTVVLTLDNHFTVDGITLRRP